MLEYLIKHTNQTITRQTLAEHVWGDRNLDLFSNALEAHICELRKRLRVHTPTDFIHTINGRGYKFISKA
jgi:DNA-binding response OmpR family regulator